MDGDASWQWHLNRYPQRSRRGVGVVIVQAEVNGDGEVIYGVIARYSIRAVPASAFVRIAAMGPWLFRPPPVK